MARTEGNKAVIQIPATLLKPLTDGALSPYPMSQAFEMLPPKEAS
jgi:hypothetical protein